MAAQDPGVGPAEDFEWVIFYEFIRQLRGH